MPNKKDEAKYLLGNGAARNAADAMRSRNDRQKKQLDQVMKALSETRKKKEDE